MKLHQGFSLLELLIALSIGLALLLVMINITSEQKYSYLLQQGQLQVIEKSQVLDQILTQQLSRVGQVNIYDSNTLVGGDDLLLPIVLPNTLINNHLLGSEDNLVTPDKLVFYKVDNKTCSGAKYKSDALKQNSNLHFHIIEEWFLDGNKLKCRVYDGLYLTGASTSALSSHSVTLLDHVYDLQFMYLIHVQDTWQWLSLNQYIALLEQHSVSNKEQSITAKVKLKGLKVTAMLRSDVSFYIDNQQNTSMQIMKVNNDGIYLTYEQTIKLSASM